MAWGDLIFINLLETDTPNRIDCDFCIVGAGAAGITLALTLARQGHSVTILESGGFEFSQEVQKLYEGTISEPGFGSHYALDTMRLRYFGGTTNHWGGYCRPMDKITFAERSWIPLSGWPISHGELMRYIPKAAEFAGIANQSFDPKDWKKAFPRNPYLFPENHQFFTPSIRQISVRPRFKEQYRDEISSNDRITCYLNINVLSCALDEDNATIKSLEAATFSKKKSVITAKNFILSLGGIETARILLHSKTSSGKAIGDHSDFLGRCFMEHPVVSNVGTCYLGEKYRDKRFFEELHLEKVEKWVRKDQKDIKFFESNQFDIGFSLSEAAQNQEKLRNATIIFASSDEIKYADPEISDHERALFRLINGSNYQTSTLRKLKCFFAAEQAPDRNNRLKLTDQLDHFGQNKLHLNWNMSPKDKESVYRTLILFAREFTIFTGGRMKLSMPDPKFNWDTVTGGAHHTGATRMSASPLTGVVDQNLQVFGVKNLYIASSSVFPTSGASVPTMNMLALTLRLADHLIKSK